MRVLPHEFGAFTHKAIRLIRGESSARLGITAGMAPNEWSRYAAGDSSAPARPFVSELAALCVSLPQRSRADSCCPVIRVSVREKRNREAERKS